MKKSSLFHSFLGFQIDSFLSHHRALGKKYDSEENSLRLFDRYLSEETDIVAIEHITPALLEQFLLSRPRSTHRSYNTLHGVLYRLFRWLIVQQVLAENPLAVRPRSTSQRRLPYLFDRSTVETLLGITAALPDTYKSHKRGATYRMIFALMYGVGLRVSEAAKLTLQDVDHENQCLLIRETKFLKDRLVPLGPRMYKALKHHIEYSQSKSPSSTDPLFSLSLCRQRPILSKAISRTFHHRVATLKLTVPPGTYEPRLHCLRHSFAVSTLVRWYRSGVDPAGQLMYLSVFLGHVNPTSTAVYLTVTAELLELAKERFQTYVEPVLLEAGQ